MYYGIKVAVGQTNSKIFDLVDLARRQLDHLGRDGIAAKKRQKNRRYLRKGFLRFPLRSQGQVRKVLRRINRLGEPAIQVNGYAKLVGGKRELPIIFEAPPDPAILTQVDKDMEARRYMFL